MGSQQEFMRVVATPLTCILLEIIQSLNISFNLIEMIPTEKMFLLIVSDLRSFLFKSENFVFVGTSFI